ncbi:MAG: DUF1848 domain-containing protein [Sphaerochaetaceae bacterium]|jgi:hypothetical protein|nr:DUF1848 domain-containing protein [Sphaerochaetaceae bacterium]MDX9809427.1 DUF1848 domain-containing protein [Sphaerochaetaceae bacterium]NLV84787.1 DUF1848 domain-containing protein [Spirochaetales bacterium]
MERNDYSFQIISASRRTDIPNHYAAWFMQRIREQFLLVRNARDYHQVRKVDLSPGAVACIVFWTKDPQPLIQFLPALSSYHYYFLYTINAYGPDIEPRTPPMGESIDRFKALADKLGSDRMVWRYDPILVNRSYPIGYHVESFNYISRKLEGYTDTCITSFVDPYKNTSRHAADLQLTELDLPAMRRLMANFATQASAHHIKVQTCAEPADFDDLGVVHGSCIDSQRIQRITGLHIETARHPSLRPFCRCAPSIDIGTYNTCINLCKYCYANYNERLIHANYARSRSGSPLQIGQLEKSDKLIERKVKAAGAQLALFDTLEKP